MSFPVADDRVGVEARLRRGEDHLVGPIGSEQATRVEVSDNDPVASIGLGLEVAVRVAGAEGEFDPEFLGRGECSDGGECFAGIVVDDGFEFHGLSESFAPAGDFERLVLFQVDGVPVDVGTSFEAAADTGREVDVLSRGGRVVLVGSFGQDAFFGQGDPGPADCVGEACPEPILEDSDRSPIGPGWCWAWCGDFQWQSGSAVWGIAGCTGKSVARDEQLQRVVGDGCWVRVDESRACLDRQRVDAQEAVFEPSIDDVDLVAAIGGQLERDGGFAVVELGVSQFGRVGCMDREDRCDLAIEALGAAGDVDPLSGLAIEGEGIAIGVSVEFRGDGAGDWDERGFGVGGFRDDQDGVSYDEQASGVGQAV